MGEVHLLDRSFGPGQLSLEFQGVSTRCGSSRGRSASGNAARRLFPANWKDVVTDGGIAAWPLRAGDICLRGADMSTVADLA
jgi:hypothetical protein